MEDEEEVKVPEINSIQLKELLASNNPPFLLDVRESWEAARGIIPGAAHIVMNTIPDRLSEIPIDRQVVVYCAVGGRSYTVAAFLLTNGFANVINLEDGITGWAKGGGPISRG